jgi:hypothetical protein
MTTPRASGETRIRALLLACQPEERLRMAARMFAGARVLVQAGFGGPGGDDPEMRRHIFRRFYGRDFPAGERERILAYLTARG